ncbi:MAG: dihydrolipoyl dehydrogenase, partial [Nitrospinota bacterium]
GTCLHWGCIPSKSLIASAGALRTIRRAGEFGIRLEGRALPDLAAMVERKDKVVAALARGIESLFKSHGVDHIRGQGALLDRGRIRVEAPEGLALEVEGEKVLIATGSRPAPLPAFPIDGERILSSDQAVHLRELPPSLLIIGAGAIGCEFAFLYRELGADVTVVELLERALPQGDEDVSRTIGRELRKAGVKLLTGCKILRVAPEAEEMVAHLEGGEKLSAHKVLVSVGRALNSDGVGLEGVGVELARGGAIRVDERMETSVPGIYAAGDVVGGMLLAHKASAEGVVAVENALGRDARMDYSAIPAGVFTHPEVGVVGMSEREAREAGHDVRVGRFLLRALGKAMAEGETAGEVKVVADGKSGRLLGVHIVGDHAADLVHEAALAIRSGLTVADLARTVHAHPTLAEAIQEAAHDVGSEAIHLPRR